MKDMGLKNMSIRQLFSVFSGFMGSFSYLLAVMGLFIGSFLAHAAESVSDTNHANKGDAWGSMLTMTLIFVVMYFLMLRPQNKRAKEHKQAISNIKVGDEIVTNSGIMGKVNNINNSIVLLEIANGVEIKIQKQAFSHSLPKGTINATNFS